MLSDYYCFLLFSDNQSLEIRKCFKWAGKTFLLFLACNIVYIAAHIILYHKLPGDTLHFWYKILY